MARIVLVGAGSVVFTKNLLSDILTFPELADTSTLVLHDIDADRLAAAAAMAQWMVAELGVGTRVEAHADRRAAFDGADYVINVIAVGGMKAAKIDFDIPRRYGLRQTIADTLGIGGIFRALRTIPIMVGLGNDMAELCPNALLLNYTNPMSMIPWAAYAGTPIHRVVGLCHSARDTQSTLARLVGVPLEEISFITAGVNHQAFVLRFERAGENLYGRLDQVIEADPELRRKVRVEMYRRLGYFPTESSEHGSEYLPWFLPHPDQVEQFRVPVDAYLQWLRANLDSHEQLVRRLQAGEGVDIQPTHELASLVIHSLETGTPRTVHGNVRNDGLITNLPSAACVEVPCFVDRSGVQPTRVGELPPQLAALNRTYLNVSELTVLAALEGRRDHVYHAAMLDPNTAATLTLEQIHQMVDELIVAHGDALPTGVRSRTAVRRSSMDRRLVDLPLRRYRPKPRLIVPSHHVPRARHPAVDAHTHLGRWLSEDGSWTVPDVAALLDLMDECNVRAVVNLDGRWGQELADNLERYDRAHPDRFATFCHVDWTELARPGFGERLANGLAQSVAAGAAGLKVWKDLGLHVRDHHGELILLDDPRLAPLWATAAEQGIPVAIHTADPVAFFDAPSESNERLELLLERPDWSFADSVFPRFVQLIDALEAVVSAHPGTTFIGVHAGCYPENLGWVGRMLDTYPNFHIDIAARIAELGRQPRATRELILRHPDRVLFGTDQIPPTPEAYQLHYRFLETADEHFPHSTQDPPLAGRWPIYGLELPDDALRKLYVDNALRLVPRLST